MGVTVQVNPPKTPVTEKSGDKAPATVPNMCKMPGPPAPFVPAPLPNVGESNDNLTDCTTTVLIEGAKVAIKGSYYMSKGDMASKGTGGGMVSATTHGKTEFVAPGSMTVKAQSKNIQLLGDAMTNNGNLANSLTAPGNLQDADDPSDIEGWLCKVAEECHKASEKKNDEAPKKKKKDCSQRGTEKHKCCEEYIKAHKGDAPIETEVGFKPDGTKVGSGIIDKAKKAAGDAYYKMKEKAIRWHKSWRKMTKGVYQRELAALKGVDCIADVVVGPPPSPPKPYDFKFNCTKDAEMSTDQQGKYNNLTKLGVLDKVQIIGKKLGETAFKVMPI